MFSDDEAYHCSLTPLTLQGGGKTIPDGTLQNKCDVNNVKNSDQTESPNKPVKGEDEEGEVKGGEGDEEGEGGGYGLEDIDSVLNEDKPKTLFNEGGLLEEIR